MSICGMITEYNPFHLGHAWHLSETRRYLGADCILICAMSGNFVQRGDFALLDKYDRAAMAAEAGADLVVELPLPAALSSAEGFAQGGTSLLSALGCTHLSFGAECADIPLLQRAAAILNGSAVRPYLTEALRSGLSYPAAMQAAVQMIDPQAAALLTHPNNTLGIAYCAALAGTDIQPVAIPRAGAAHDSSTAKDGYASASYLRSLIDSQQREWARWMPPAAAQRIDDAIRAGRAPMQLINCDAALLAHLRRMDAAALRPFAAAEDGFAERLASAIQKGCTFEEVCDAAQTRRFPLARIRRTLLRAYLGLTENMPVKPSYIRVLAVGRRGSEVLRNMRGKMPIIVKPTAERRLPNALQPALRLDALADALYALAAPDPAQRSAQSRWKKTPFTWK